MADIKHGELIRSNPWESILVTEDCDGSAHSHACAEIVYVTDGALEVRADDEHHVVSEDHILYIPPCTEHSVRNISDINSTFHRIAFLPEALVSYGDECRDVNLARWFDSRAGAGVMILDVSETPSVLRAVKAVHSAYESRGCGDEFTILSQMLFICDFLCRNEPDAGITSLEAEEQTSGTDVRRFAPARTERSITRSWAIHRFHKIIFLTEGEGILEMCNKTVLLQAGNMVYIKRGEKYRFTKLSEKIHTIVLQVDSDVFLGDGIGDDVATLKIVPDECFMRFRYDQCNPATSDIYADILGRENFSDVSDAAVRSWCMSISADVVRQSQVIRAGEDAPDGRCRDNISAIINYIDRHYTDNLRLKELGARFGVSYSHLSRSFRKMTGMSFNRYINSKRMAHAQTLLLSTDYTVSKIAALLGYCRRSHFTEQYAEFYGETPYATRKAGDE